MPQMMLARNPATMAWRMNSNSRASIIWSSLLVVHQDPVRQTVGHQFDGAHLFGRAGIHGLQHLSR